MDKLVNSETPDEEKMELMRLIELIKQKMTSGSKEPKRKKVTIGSLSRTSTTLTAVTMCQTPINIVTSVAVLL